MTPKSISKSVLSLSLHEDLTLNCDGQGGLLADLPCGKGYSFYISIDLAVASQIRHVTFAPSFFGNASLNWEKGGLPPGVLMVTKVVSAYYEVSSYYAADTHSPSPHFTHPHQAVGHSAMLRVQGKGASPYPCLFCLSLWAGGIHFPSPS